MIKSQPLFDTKTLYSKEHKNNIYKNKEKNKNYIQKSKINKNNVKNEEINEEEENDDISNVEKIKIYHTKKRSSKLKEKPAKKLYHNEIDKRENNEIKIIRNNSKMKHRIPQLELVNSNPTLNNVCVTERTYEKNDDLHCMTMAATPKRNFSNNFGNLISLNKNIKSPKPFLSSKSSKKYFHQRNNIKSNDLKELYDDKYSNLYLSTQGIDNNLVGEYLNEISTNHLEKEKNDPLLSKNNESTNKNNRRLKTQREKSFNKNLLIDIINNSDLGNKFSNIKNRMNSSQKGSLKNLKISSNLFLNKNKINKDIKSSYNSSQKNIFTLKDKNNQTQNIKSNTNTNFNSYKSLSKSKENTKYLNKTFYYPKSSITHNSVNSKFYDKQNDPFRKNNFKKKLYLDVKETNKYLAPIIESNIVIENENCHFLENTICTKNKIVKKKKNLYGEQTKELFNLNENNNDKKNNKNGEKTKNEKDKNIYLFTDSNKNTNKLTFTNAINKLYKKPQKKQDKKPKINNIKIQKTYNNNLIPNNIPKNNHILNNASKNNNNLSNNNINNISNYNTTDNIIKITNNIPEMNHHRRNKSRQKAYIFRAESIDKSLSMSISNLSAIANSNIFNGKIEDYLITKELGKGSYATVKLAMHKMTKQKYAIKIYTKESLLDPQKRNTVKNEINILKQLNHNNIMKLYEVIDSSKFYYLVLEYIKGISLLEVVKAEKCHYIEQNRALKLFTQIVKGISYCQSKNINHRDIKLENILVLSNDTIKIIDFGFAVKANKETYQTLLCGTPSYMPPEIVNKENYIAQYSDIWSLGVLLYTMLYGRFPFRAKDDEKLFSLINEGNIIFPENISVDENVKNLIKKIMNVNPRLRPSPEEIINDIILID